MGTKLKVDLTDLQDADLYPYGGLERNRRIIELRFKKKWTLSMIAKEVELSSSYIGHICDLTALRQARRQERPAYERAPV